MTALRSLLPLVLAALVPVAAGVAGCSEPEPPRNAILVLVDTMRADRLSAYGYPTPTTPVIDALAEDGVLFETVVSSGAWTLPGMAGIFAGDFPNQDIYDERLKQSLVPHLRDAGFRTAAFVEGGFVSDAFGFDRGFDEFVNTSTGSFLAQGHGAVVTERTFRLVDEWLRENAEHPFFLVVHTYEPHTPYTRLEYAAGLDRGALNETFSPLDAGLVQRGDLPFGDVERRYVRALYDGGVSMADRAIGGMLATLEEIGIEDETVVVVTSDHGEDIGGRTPEWPGVHGHHLYDELLLVPLVVHDPTRSYPVKRVTQQVRTIDVMHTILDLLGFEDLPAQYGKSVVPLMTGEEISGRFAWSRSVGNAFFAFPERSSLRAAGHKLILTTEPDGSIRTELFDLASDPGERVDRSQADLRRVRQMTRQLTRLQRGIERPAPAHYTIRAPRDPGNIEERLRALGYTE